MFVFVVLSQMQGLKGTYIVNQLTDNNPHTLISYDQGGNWTPIPAPLKDRTGGATNCQLVRTTDN